MARSNDTVRWTTNGLWDRGGIEKPPVVVREMRSKATGGKRYLAGESNIQFTLGDLRKVLPKGTMLVMRKGPKLSRDTITRTLQEWLAANK